MKCNYLQTNRFFIPFRKKYLGGFMLICSLAVGAAAADDIQVNSDDSRKLVKQAEKLVKRGSLVEAEKLLRRAITASPDNSTAKLRLAFICVKQRRLGEAYELSFNVAKAEPNNAHAFAVLGATLLSAGKFPESRAMFFNSLRLNKREALSWAGYGMIDFYENRIQESFSNLEEAVFHDPEQPDYYFAYAQVAARSEKYREAADAYNKFLAVSRDVDDERRARIKGLINFLRFLGQKNSLYTTSGSDTTSVPFKLRGNRPIIQLKINGKGDTLNFVLDTGSGISVISDKTAERLNIGSITKGGFARGIGGDGKFEIVYGFLRQIEIGDVKIRSVPVYIRKFHTDGNEIDGYIGLALISKFLTTIDYGNLTFSLAKKAEYDMLAVEDAGVSLPLRLTSSGFLSGQVQLEGVTESLNFIVDTGASVSVISDDVASMEGITPFASSERMRVIGSAGITEDVPSFLLPKVSFGKHSRKSITAIALDLDMINEASGFEQAGILGGNFLRNYRMTFDFRNSRVTFVPINIEK
ncbi:MAG: aspartyl protease family protein [Saprospiraceae bacterium]|nr:aspartyl protease family protein [Pyrinomonadaceae bacterium]